MERSPNYIELNQSIINPKYSLTLYDNYILLISFFDFNLEKELLKTSFSNNYRIDNTKNNILFYISKLDNTKVTEEDLYNINIY
jgi:hypothetical protein